jgi:hypothetical protein
MGEYGERLAPVRNVVISMSQAAVSQAEMQHGYHQQLAFQTKVTMTEFSTPMASL